MVAVYTDFLVPRLPRLSGLLLELVVEFGQLVELLKHGPVRVYAPLSGAVGHLQPQPFQVGLGIMEPMFFSKQSHKEKKNWGLLIR